MKIIFLDIDGVLNNRQYRSDPKIDYYENFISEEHMWLLEHLVRITGAKIVLTSTLRMYWSTSKQQFSPEGEYINRVFKEHNLDIHDKTYDLDGDRDAEITEWLDKHKGEVEKYVIIDDYPFAWSAYNKKYWVRTYDEIGLTEETVEACADILNVSNEMVDIDVEKCKEITDLIKSEVFDDFYETYFENKLKPIGFFPDSKLVVFFADLESKFFLDLLFQRTLLFVVKEVFDNETEYVIEDNDIVDKKHILSKFWTSKTAEVKAFKINERLNRMLNESPELLFHSENMHIEMLFRLLLIFVNLSEIGGLTSEICVKRNNDILEIYSNDLLEFRIDKVNEGHSFRNSDYEFVIGKGKKRRYVPCPFHLNSTKSRDLNEPFYPNVDSYFSMFLAIRLLNLTIESVKDDVFTKITYNKGKNRMEDVGVTDKPDGTYISYFVSKEELSNEEIQSILKTLAFLCRRLKVSFKTGEKVVQYCYDNLGACIDRLKKAMLSLIPTWCWLKVVTVIIRCFIRLRLKSHLPLREKKDIQKVTTTTLACR